jgi:hypothetical protein
MTWGIPKKQRRLERNTYPNFQTAFEMAERTGKRIKRELEMGREGKQLTERRLRGPFSSSEGR